MNSYIFNVTFTRPDEQDAVVYHSGFNTGATDAADAEQRVREAHSHLTLLTVTLMVVLNSDGDRIWPTTATVTARVEVEFPLTINEGNVVRAAAAAINANQWTLDFVERFADGLRLAFNAETETAPWLVYRGGSHVALIKDGERILLVTEQRPVDPLGPTEGDLVAEDGGKAYAPPVAAPQAPQATTAPTVSRNDPVDVFVNQASREGYVLAVLGDEYIEYTMPKGTTALQIRRVDGGTIVSGRYHREYRNVAYKALPTRWLQAIVDAGTSWEGKAQGVYRVYNDRWGKSGNSYNTVPSAADLLASKKAVR